MTPSFFETAAVLRAWLRKNHATASELWIGFHKAGSGRGGITYKEALDEALCQGWIDGVRKTLDEHRWTIRFTPRLPRSRWSAVNRKRAAELAKAGRLRPAGRKAYAARDRRPPRGYSYEHPPKRLAPPREKAFRAQSAAWAFFAAQPPSYRQKGLYWVESAVQDETRSRRLRALVEASAHGTRLGALSGKKN